MTKQMEINNSELIELIKDEPEIAYVYNPYGSAAKRVGNKKYSRIVIYTTSGDLIVMQWQQGQTYKVSQSNNGEIHPNNTISVDEILDIVL